MKELRIFSSNGHETRCVGRLLFHVNSFSRPWLIHVVDLESEQYGEKIWAHICTCESFKFHNRPCRHVQAVAEAIAHWANIPEEKCEEWIERVLYSLGIGRTLADALTSKSLDFLRNQPKPAQPEKKARVYHLPKNEASSPKNHDRLPSRRHMQPA